MEPVYTLGVDVGSTASKTVLLEGGARIAGRSLVPLGAGTSGPARAVEEDCGELSDRLLIREVCATEEGVILLVDVPATLEGLAAGQ